MVNIPGVCDLVTEALPENRYNRYIPKEKKPMHVNNTRCPANHPCPALRICPVGAITQRGYGLPVINKELCIECGKCVRVCPMRAITM
ncbi:MAG: DUF362 domain-containing protein [Sphaerochaetaceae bacterium]